MSDRRSVRSQIGRRDAVVCRGCSHLKNINLYSLGAAHLKMSNWLGAKKFGFGNILYLFISHYNLSFSLIFSLSHPYTHYHTLAARTPSLPPHASKASSAEFHEILTFCSNFDLITGESARVCGVGEREEEIKRGVCVCEREREKERDVGERERERE